MSSIYVTHKDDGYWLVIDGKTSAMIHLGSRGPIVQAAIEESIHEKATAWLSHREEAYAELIEKNNSLDLWLSTARATINLFVEECKKSFVVKQGDDYNTIIAKSFEYLRGEIAKGLEREEKLKETIRALRGQITEREEKFFQAPEEQ